MKLISTNIEGRRHYERITPFLDRENADVICVMEAPDAFAAHLEDKGYHTTFAPMRWFTDADERFLEGVVFASKAPHTALTHYYHRPHEEMQEYVSDNKRGTIAHPVIVATVHEFTIATTHFTWNPHGEAYFEPQAIDVRVLKSFLATQPAHILCGDMNIPRTVSPHHADLVSGYTDAIPTEYQSSLDASLHRLGADDTKRMLFDSFMVDYLLTQPPYEAHDVRLEFGVSDHAAIVATLERASTTPPSHSSLSYAVDQR